MFFIYGYALFFFIIFCSDHVHEDERAFWIHFIKSIAWPYTVFRWLTYRSLDKLARTGAIVWFILTTGWLVSLLHDHLTVWASLSYMMMVLVVYCVDFMSDLHGKPIRRVLRGLFWPKAIFEYFRKVDSIPLIQASLTIWLFLTTGWMLSLMSDRLVK